MNRYIFILLLFTFLILWPAEIIFGQQTAIYKQPEAKYRLAYELFEKQKYGAAQEQFTEIIQSIENKRSLIRIESEYYDAVCALKLENGDAEYKLMSFIENHPGHSNSQLAYFQYGKLQFKKGKFKKALALLKEVNIYNLNQDERSEYFFKKGYCLFKQEDYSRAKTEFRKLINGDTRYTPDGTYYYAYIAYLEGDYESAIENFEKIKELRAYNKIAPLFLAHIYHKQQNYNKMLDMAIPLYNSASNKDKPELALLIGDAYYQNGNYKEAEQYLEFHERSSRKALSRENSYELAYTLYKNGRYQDAIYYFQDVAKENDELSQNAYYHLGYCYLKTDQKKFASTAFATAFKYAFDKQIAEDALFNYAKLSMEVSRDPYNTAISNLEKYIGDYPDSDRINEAYTYLVNLYLSTNNYSEALESIGKIKNKTKELDVAYQKILFFKGIELFNQNEFNEAINMFKRSQDYNFDQKITNEASFWTGEAFYRQNNYWAAIKYYREYLSSGSAVQSDIYPVALYNMGYAHFKRKSYENAITYFKKFINKHKDADPKMVNDAYIRTGDCYFIIKEYKQAIRNYNEAIRMKLIDTDYALKQKAITQGALGKINDKINTLNLMLKNYPKSPLADDAKYEIATSYLILNNNQKALDYFNRVVKEHPKSSYATKAMLKTGLIYYSQNKNEQAIRTLKDIIEKYPGSSQSKEALASLRNIYIDLNKVDEYYTYANGLSFTDVSMTEQDSTTYIAAENIYMENRCDDAIAAFGSYIDRFPNGYFSANANYYKAECLIRKKDNEKALKALRNVINLPGSGFTTNALLKASEITYELKNYPEALKYYIQLEEVAGNNNNLLISLAGQMRCNYILEKYDQANAVAQKLLKTETVSNEIINEAHIYLARSFFHLDDLNNAQREFAITEKLTDTEIGAEAKYHLAFLAFEMGEYHEAENLIFELIDHYAAYDYWVARSFILLADVYMKLDNIFQAKQTLQSIIDNYEGPELVIIAQQKLDSISNKQ
jgi:TolA-binding protein